MQANLLILHPADPDAAMAGDTLVAPLRKIGFIGASMDFQGRRHYRPGEDFLQLVTFLGCSPVVSLGEPGKTGDEFCHVAVHEPLEAPVLVAGANAKAPRCPACCQADSRWGETFRPGHPIGDEWRCPNCGQTAPAESLNWRQSAGIARTFIVVWGIFEGEAVHSQEFLTSLEGAGGGPWTCFYYRGAPPL